MDAVEFAVGAQEIPAEVAGAAFEQPYADWDAFLGLAQGEAAVAESLEFAQESEAMPELAMELPWESCVDGQNIDAREDVPEHNR